MREGAIVEKRRKLELQLQEFKSQKKHLSPIQKSLQVQGAHVTLREEAIILHPQVKVEKLD